MPRLSLLVVCAVCSRAVPRKMARQKYCAPCSNELDVSRKTKWAKANPLDETQIARRNELEAGKRSAIAAFGESVSVGTPMGSWGLPKLAWKAQIAFPFDQNLSKNALWRTGYKGHVYLREEAKKARDVIEQRFRKALKSMPLKHNKIWIELLVQKPHHRGDAINFVDSICDALKKSTEVDDRWFSISRVDWEIVKVDPQIFVGLGQEECENSIACSSCGGIKSFEMFAKNRSMKLGVTRNCKECVSGGRAKKRGAA